MKHFNSIIQSLRLIILVSISLGYHSIAHADEVVTTQISGTIWLDQDDNDTNTGEPGLNEVTVQLIDIDGTSVFAETLSENGVYAFDNIPAGTYSLRIPPSEFANGAALEGTVSCAPFNPADDMIDNDDNGSPIGLQGVRTSTFTLSNNDPSNPVMINYIDFCFTFSCDLENPIASTSCTDIDELNIICDIFTLGTFCNILPSLESPGVQPDPLCSTSGSGEANNISWFAFQAYDGNYVISINAFGCTNGGLSNDGIQVGVYTDCSFETSIFCLPNCTTETINIESNILNPGQIYYLFIDGCGTDQCGYEIDILGTPTLPTINPIKVCTEDNGMTVCDTVTYCTDAPVSIISPDMPLVADYGWTITTIAGTPYDGDASPSTRTSNVDITFKDEGIYEVCLTSVYSGCGAVAWSGNLCTIIETSDDVPRVDDEFFTDQLICQGAIASFDIEVISDQDPNGDGQSGWLAPPQFFDVGTNTAIIATPGCSYEQEITIIEAAPSDVGQINETICPDDLPYQIDQGNVITEAAFATSNIFELDSIQIMEGTSLGCDSFVNVSIELLNIEGGQIQALACTYLGIELNFEYEAALSTNPLFLDFNWFDPSGNPINDNLNPNDPLDIILPLTSQSGIYTVEATASRSGTSCTFFYELELDIDAFVPSTPQIVGDLEVCSVGSTEGIYLATDDGTATIGFRWTWPDDVSSAVVSGSRNEVITIDWSGSAGGTITAIALNSCAESDPTSATVTILDQPDASFDLNPELCINELTSVQYPGDAAQIDEYMWNFGGAILVNGSTGVGPGPHFLLFNSDGEQSISLTVTDSQGCISEEHISTTMVDPLPIAPIISCNASINQIEFTWETTPGYDYDVQVTSGQSGISTAGGQYLVQNLVAGEQVSITILVTDINSTCDMSVQASVMCQAQDCPNAEIDLAVDKTSFCAGANEGTFVITATVANTDPGTGTFQGPGIINEVGIFDPAQADVGANNIVYTFITNSGCLYTEVISLIVNPQPSASFALSTNEVCIGERITITYTGPADATTIAFSSTGGTIQTVDPDAEIFFDTEGSYDISLVVTDANGCVSETYTETVVVGSTEQELEISCTSGEGFITFSWDAIPGATGYLVTVNDNEPLEVSDNMITVNELGSSEAVKVLVEVLSNDVCLIAEDEAICVSILTNTNDNAQAKVNIYPNPANNHIIVEGIEAQSELLLYDIHSRLLMRKSSRGTIDVGHLPAGIYLIKVLPKGEDKAIIRRLIKS